MTAVNPPASNDDLSLASEQPTQRFDLRHPDLALLLRGLLHELRNPLSSILTAATLLQDSPADQLSSEESQMLLDVLRKESLHLNHILTEFARYVKLPPPQPNAFDLTNAIRATIHELQRETVLSPQISVSDELPAAVVWADESQVRSALRHLLSNSAEAMPNGGRLLLCSTEPSDGDYVAFCLADSGQGFTSESRQRAFQPFYSTKARSLGLGLPAVRSIIEAAGGRVWLEGSPNGASEEIASGESTSDEFASNETNTPAESLRVCVELPRAH